MSSEKLNLDNELPPLVAQAAPHDFKLSDYRGKKLVLYFYPKDNTPGCTSESIAFRDHFDAFAQTNTAIVGISRDSLRSHESFIKKLELPFTLISDPDEILCEQFDVMREKKRYGKITRGIERSTFLINENAQVIKQWRAVKVSGHIDEILEAIKNI